MHAHVRTKRSSIQALDSCEFVPRRSKQFDIEQLHRIMSSDSKSVELSALPVVGEAKPGAPTVVPAAVNAVINIAAPAIDMEAHSKLPFTTLAELEALSDEKVAEMTETFSLQQYASSVFKLIQIVVSSFSP